MTKIRRRHWVVDVGFLVAGGFFSAALPAKSVGYALAALVIGLLTIWCDRRNIEDEEQEIVAAAKGQLVIHESADYTV